ncbi:hypothetical protein Tco_0893753 [Tanacetum coccineum]|uniref:Uncharacterized protein n=1 Tax=Tanacetum coccineum TaxID=301880 RepID=A0ABQ5C9U8_9ASTR
MKVKESLNVTFDETPPPPKTSPLKDDDLVEEKAIEVNKTRPLGNDLEDKSLENNEIINIKESKSHPLDIVIGLEVGSIRRIQVLDTAYWGFLGVGTTLDIFQNIHILYLEYGVLSLSGYGVLSFIPLWSLVSAGTDTPYLP